MPADRAGYLLTEQIMVDEQNVLNFVRSGTYRQMTTDELVRHFSVSGDETGEFVALLEDLERAGELVKVKKKHWVNPARA
ncbi:MAG: hypothetical protein PVJ27_11050, partial [Candidatus Brocadiaceae bacterium]